MVRTIAEKKVLDKLGITDFRQLTKDKVITMATMIDKMDPEVAKKALEQFPGFSGTMKAILTEYKEYLEKGLESNDESVRSCYESSDTIIMSLQEELKNDSMSFDEKKDIINAMIELQNMKNDMDAENKKHIRQIMCLGLAAFCVATAGLLTALGNNLKIEVADTD